MNGSSGPRAFAVERLHSGHAWTVNSMRRFPRKLPAPGRSGLPCRVPSSWCGHAAGLERFQLVEAAIRPRSAWRGSRRRSVHERPVASYEAKDEQGMSLRSMGWTLLDRDRPSAQRARRPGMPRYGER
jgi:hypothetical protein